MKRLSFVWLVLAMALLAPPARADESFDLPRARALDKDGVKAFSEGRYLDAARAFEEAYRLGGPAFELWNVAKCYLRLERTADAAQVLERYLALPHLPREDRQEATELLDTLKKRSSSLRIETTPSGVRVEIDDKPVGVTPLETKIGAGSHVVRFVYEDRAPDVREIEAKYGAPIELDVRLGERERRPPSPVNPYESGRSTPFVVRGYVTATVPRYGSMFGALAPGLVAMGTYRIAELASVQIGVGGLVALSRDSWDNRPGVADVAAPCGALASPYDAMHLSAFAIGLASVPMARGFSVSGVGGIGMAGLLADDLGGELFVPRCNASWGVRPAVRLGAQIDYALTRMVRLSAMPLSIHVQPAFHGARTAPEDVSGMWLRLSFGLGAGVDF